VNGERIVKRFSPWCLKVLAGIGALPRTLAERSVTALLQKKRKGVKSIRLRERDTAEFAELRSKALRWANDNRQQLEDLRDRNTVSFPDALGDRDSETWEPLLAISLLAGEVWQNNATHAAEVLTGAETSDDDEYGVLLLAHIREVFDGNDDHTSLPSKFILDQLHGNEEWPWRERGSGKDRQRPLTLSSMQRFLHDFQIDVEPRAVRHEPPHGEKRGYLRAKFEEAWQIYCAPHGRAAERETQATQETQGVKNHRQGVPSVQSLTATGIWDTSEGVSQGGGWDTPKTGQKPAWILGLGHLGHLRWQKTVDFSTKLSKGALGGTVIPPRCQPKQKALRAEQQRKIQP
jgi:hypothetical protein